MIPTMNRRFALVSVGSQVCVTAHMAIYIVYHFLTNENAELAILCSNLHKNRVTCCTAEFLLFAILC